MKATEATLEGIVNPNNDPTECKFQYGSANVTENEVGCSQGLLTGLVGQGVSATVTGLKPGTYKYRLVAKSRKGEEAIGPEKEFKKLVAPPEKPTTEEAQEITNGTAELHGVVNQASPSSVSWFFEYAAGSSCTGAGVSTTPAQGPEEVQAHLAEVKITGLRAGTKYTFCLLAENEGKEKTAGNEVSFTTTDVPQAIDSESVSGVASTSATLEAQINPLWNDTTYYFEYGETTGYEDPAVPAPPGLGVGSGEGDVGVSVHLQGLAAGTAYHYRVVASSVLRPEIVGPDRTFTTQGAGSVTSLPDGRSYEMVSPPNKHGAGIYPIGREGGSDIQAAAGGDGFTFAATAPFATNPHGSRSIERTQVFSNRTAPGIWETADITTPHNEGISQINVGSVSEYKLFSSELSLGIVEPKGDTPLPPLPAGSEKTVYARHNGQCASTPAVPIPATCYQALVSAANVPEGTEFGGDGGSEGGVEFVSASPDLGHVVLQTVAGAQGKGGPAPSLTETAVPQGGLYEWSGGQIQLASVLPDSEPTTGTFLQLGGHADNPVYRHAISNDGSRAIWSAVENHVRSLYMRDMVRGETVKLGENVEFETASSDASRVFFSDGTTLETKGSLNVFEVTSGEGEPLAGRTTTLAGSGPVRGVIGASEDGSYVYFVSGADDLYVNRYDEATKAWAPPTFIAALSAADGPSWGFSGGSLSLGTVTLQGMTSRVSPNGRYLAFMSERSLTGYDNRDANSGVPDEEVFEYHASEDPEGESSSHPPSLVCVSCDPTGARPLGLFDFAFTAAGASGAYVGGPLVDYDQVWAGGSGRWLAGNVPSWTPVTVSSALYQSRYLSDSGRLYFDSSDGLVPADVNAKEDVYEYEPQGVPVGSSYACSPASTDGSDVFESARPFEVEGRKGESGAGCVALISSGTSSEESAFLDASESGGDVFFLTTSKLSPADYDTSYDIYDAHECTSEAPCAPPAALPAPPCETEASCKAAPSPQPEIYGAPSSMTFSGAGNITQPPPPAVGKPKTKTVKCAKGRKLSYGKCVKAKSKKRAKKASHNGRAGR